MNKSHHIINFSCGLKEKKIKVTSLGKKNLLSLTTHCEFERFAA
jgi:hypothetical protein